MSKDEYRKAFKDSGLKASSWCKFLGISEYQHRNYQNGRTKVPERVSNIIEAAQKMIEGIKNKSGA